MTSDKALPLLNGNPAIERELLLLKRLDPINCQYARAVPDLRPILIHPVKLHMLPALQVSLNVARRREPYIQDLKFNLKQLVVLLCIEHAVLRFAVDSIERSDVDVYL